MENNLTRTVTESFTRIELANRIGRLNGRVCAVGNLYLVRGVERFSDGCTRTWTISQHLSREAAVASMHGGSL